MPTPEFRAPADQLPVELILDRFGRCERQLPGCRYLHRSTGSRIASLTGWSVLYLELAEAVQRNLFALAGGTCDSGEDGVDQLAGIGLGKVLAGGNGVSEFVVVHLVSAPV